MFPAMRKSDITCPECKAGYRRIDLISKKAAKSAFRCLWCNHLLEVFDGSTESGHPPHGSAREDIRARLIFGQCPMANCGGISKIEVAINVLKFRSVPIGGWGAGLFRPLLA
jgi:transposase-like protein